MRLGALGACLILAGALVTCGRTSVSTIDAQAPDVSVDQDVSGDSTIDVAIPSDSVDATAQPDAPIAGAGLVIAAVAFTRLHALSLDAAGNLTARAVVTGPEGTRHIASSADGRFVYALGSTKVMAFSVDAVTGGLGVINEADTGLTNPSGITIDTSGRWLILSDRERRVVVRALSPDGGVGGAAWATQGGLSTSAGASDPSGKFVFFGSCDADVVARYRLDPDTGELLAQNPGVQVAAASGPGPIAFHPSGNTAYVMNVKDQTITSFNYASADGTLSDPETVAYLSSGQPQVNGSCTPRHMVVHPSGRLAYASTSDGGGTVAIMSIAATGRLTVVGHEQYFLFRGPDPLAVDPTGAYLLVGNTAGALQVFRIDPVTGTLTYVSFGVQGVVALGFVGR